MCVSRAVFVLAALVALSAAGCSASKVVVTGQQRMVGGPPGTAPIPLAGSITLTNASTTLVVKTDEDGKFVAELKPGTYSVTGVGGQGSQCRADSPVVVRQGERTDPVFVNCHIK